MAMETSTEAAEDPSKGKSETLEGVVKAPATTVISSDVSALTESVAKMIQPNKPITNDESFPWAPEPGEVIQLFEYLQKNKVFAYSWECPGRRKPGEEEERAPEVDKGANSEETEAGADDFDFEEESTPVVRRPSKVLQSTLKGSAKKKTTSFAGILSNMERHRMIEKMSSSGEPGGT